MIENQRFGRYRMVKKLAAGGMAQVWLALQPGMEGFQKLLVIKQVLTHLSETEDLSAMFLDEARLAARLNHPNIVQVFDLGQVDETFYIAMEFIHGEDLRRLENESLRARKPIPIPLVCRIIADAAAGLHYAHNLCSEDGRHLGIVHRDVTPQNILVTFEGAVKIVDFGIAKAANRMNETRAGVIKGKYAYMSPEQSSAKSVDSRTDVFALGIVLHELLTGRRLFKRDTEVDTMKAVIQAEIKPPSSLNPIVSPTLDEIVMAALERDVTSRTQTAEELRMALETFILAEGKPASNAHLRLYMRELFSSRLRIEAKEGGPAGYLSRIEVKEIVPNDIEGISSVSSSLSMRTETERLALYTKEKTKDPFQILGGTDRQISEKKNVSADLDQEINKAEHLVTGERPGILGAIERATSQWSDWTWVAGGVILTLIVVAVFLFLFQKGQVSSDPVISSSSTLVMAGFLKSADDADVSLLNKKRHLQSD